MTYRIDEQRGVVFTIGTGVLTDDELIRHKKELIDDPAFKPGMVELADVRGVDQLELTTDGVAILAQMDKKDSAHLVNCKLAIVASKDVVFGMGRMYQTRTSDNPLNVSIFRDMKAACEWLGIEPQP